MRNLLIFYFAIIQLQSCNQHQSNFESYADYPIYNGTDLGITYTQSNTTVKLWAHTSAEVIFRIYSRGNGGDLDEVHKMNRKEDGVWELILNGDRADQYYTFQNIVLDDTLLETPGPYAKAVGVNGKRAMIVDLATTNPENWEADKRPGLAGPENIIIYEIHIRDMTIHQSSGANNPGIFLGLAENGTTNQFGDQTGLDHLVELGVTHVHILPSFDFRSVDETKLDQP
ncbi:MAG: type I pullulanase, partial [Bacteroidetes bacterium]